MEKMERFDFKTVKKYVDFIGDSYTHALQKVDKRKAMRIMDLFFEINKLIDEANERIEKKKNINS